MLTGQHIERLKAWAQALLRDNWYTIFTDGLHLIFFGIRPVGGIRVAKTYSSTTKIAPEGHGMGGAFPEREKRLYSQINYLLN